MMMKPDFGDIRYVGATTRLAVTVASSYRTYIHCF